MNARMQSDVIAQIITRFEQWVKLATEEFSNPHNEEDVQKVEEHVRDGVRRISAEFMERLLQHAIDQRQESSRCCPNCEQRRRHRGVRSRTLRTSFGTLTVRGIYWGCPWCKQCGHSAETLMPESFSRLMRECIGLSGAAMSSFHKAEIVITRLMGVEIDDETIRRHALATGSALRQLTPEPVAEDDELIGSCDGTMVRTREGGWRELKCYRFEHSSSTCGGAFLETAEHFTPRLKDAADRLGSERARRTTFISDLATWIRHGVRDHLPGWKHIADYWHVCQHIHAAGEAIYGSHHPRAKKWSAYWCRRLKHHGGEETASKLRRIVLHYEPIEKQNAVIALIRFLDKHVSMLNYPAYERDKLPIGSGPMESFCNQLGLRMKGPGMHWSQRNVTSMAMLVSHFSLHPERSLLAPARHRRAA
jgi:hypothetical protein